MRRRDLSPTVIWPSGDTKSEGLEAAIALREAHPEITALVCNGDMVALGALLACVFAGLVSSEAAFAGFGHPAVITVAAVLVLSRGLQSTGALDTVAQRLLGAASSPSLTIAILTLTGAVLSAFMNNVGAMALLMPVAIQFADKHELPPGRILMPLAFGTILGGMTTLIGTPPNLIVSGFRKETDAGSFGMFDFSPVGIAVALAGVAFISLIGWRLVPARPKSGAESFDTGTYLTEVNVTEDSKAAGKRLREVDEILAEADAQVIGMVRNEFRVSAPNLGRTVRAGDILVIEAEPESLSNALSSLGLKLKEDGAESDKEEADVSKSADPDTSSQDETEEEQDRDARDIELQEVVVRPDSVLIGRTAATVHLRTRYGLNLLAISRQGRHTIRRLRSTSVRAGDVLLLQGDIDSLGLFVTEFSCVPLASRAIRIPDKRRAGIAVAVMIAAIAGAAFGLVPAAVSFTAGMLAFMVFRVLPARNIYDAIDWSVIVLLAALIPVAGAVASTGAADLLARCLLEGVAMGNPIVSLVLILAVTMMLSDFMNNAATAALMCPIAISAASYLDTNTDTFLMAVAVGASCAFLTPIGHQNNTLILGPGGFRFGDYWRLGLPMEVLVVLVAVPMLLFVWPL
ncbi:MAG: anion permease [Proteobacteria bacterium]|nr:anion permease [Pseudomonadota bacterium]